MHHHSETIMIIGIVMGCLLLLLLFLLFMFIGRKKEASRELAERSAQNGDMEQGLMVTKPDKLVLNTHYPLHPFSFSIQDVLASAAEPLHNHHSQRSCFGAAYKIQLSNSSEKALVVKHLQHIKLSKKQFQQKIEQLWQLQHSNLLPIKAYYYSDAQKLLLYDYISCGSLFQALHCVEEASPYVMLDWPSRAKIAQQVAAGIAYIHSSQGDFVHGNIKSSNVLLIADMGACLTDYGIVGLYNIHCFKVRKSGYVAPELYRKGAELAQAADVYSYGVLLLELLTGRYPTPPAKIAGKLVLDLRGWVLTSIHEEWTGEVFDQNIEERMKHEDEMVAMLKIAIACVALDIQERPSMGLVLEMVELVIKDVEVKFGGELSPKCGMDLLDMESPQLDDDNFSILS